MLKLENGCEVGKLFGGKMIIKIQEGSKVTIIGSSGKMTVDLEKMII